MIFGLAFALLVLLGFTVSIRLISLLPSQNPKPKLGSKRNGSSTRLLVVLGSGGHTAEMLALLRDLDCSKYTHRTYVVSSGDAFSVGKAQEFEVALAKRVKGAAKSKQNVRSTGKALPEPGTYDISVVSRARRIHQSLLSTPFSSLKCLLECFAVLNGSAANVAIAPKGKRILSRNTRRHSNYPDLILSNGPATGAIVILAAFILRFLAMPGTKRKMRTVYVESWARVRSLSLSGKILLRVVDRFIVQWESMVPVTEGKGEFYGALV